MNAVNNLAPQSNYAGQAGGDLANADTVEIQLDFNGVAGDIIGFQTAGRDGNWSTEQQIRPGFYTIRRACEYIRTRNITGSISIRVTITMLSAYEIAELVPEGGALR